MRKKVPFVLSLALVVPLALTSSGDSRPGLAQLAETEVRAALSAVKEVSADPITTGGMVVLNPSSVPVLGTLSADATGIGFAPYSGFMTWGTSVGVTSSAGVRGLAGVNPDNSGFVAVFSSAGTAGTQITGNFGVRTFAGDLAEAFPAGVRAEPGSVMSIDPANAGGLMLAREPYDRRVAGVVSGAGAYKPAIVLDRRAGAERRLPIALVGKVVCKVDADGGAIEIGDLLTSSATPGHAMKVSDPARALGAVIGKALRPLAAGRGVIPILVALQ